MSFAYEINLLHSIFARNCKSGVEDINRNLLLNCKSAPLWKVFLDFELRIERATKKLNSWFQFLSDFVKFLLYKERHSSRYALY